ncbi:Cys-Gln thioester bond-forming surface protein [Oscillospiraceae bacterium OttesenSCG-928-F05]|nr:Cys-Gln thioester bond-forming surface protein [Oscillospiraceae bacterium OttesenSCG-928-F05]
MSITRNHGKRIISLLLAAIIILSGFGGLSAQAATISDGSRTVTIGTLDRQAYLSTSTGVVIGGGHRSYTTNDGITGPAYCINYGLNEVSSTKTLNITGRYFSSPKTMGAFANAYPQRTLAQFLDIHSAIPELSGLTESEYAYATQLAIWATLEQLGIEGTDFEQGRAMIPRPTGDAQKIRVFKAVETILATCAHWTQVLYTGMYVRAEENALGYTVSVLPGTSLDDAATFNINGIKKETVNGTEYYTRQFIGASATSTFLDGYTLAVWAENAPTGTIFTDMSNTPLTSGTFDGKSVYRIPTESRNTSLNANNSEWYAPFKICIPVSNAAESGKVTINVGARAAQYDIYLADNPTSTEQSYIIADPAYNDIQNFGILEWNEIENNPPTFVDVTKTDGVGNPLSGAKISLVASNGTSQTATTGADGKILFEVQNPALSFTLREDEAPDGYSIIPAYPVSVTAGQTNYYTVTNSPEAFIRVKKIDAQNGTPLMSAVFVFEQIDGSFKTTGTTGHDGMIHFKGPALPFGSYRIFEQTAPEHYEKSTEVKTVHWDGSADVMEIFENVRKPSVNLIKISESSHPLPGAVFKVYRDGNYITSVTTDGTGTAIVSGVTKGYWEFVEETAPTGYVLDSTTRHGIYVDPYDPATEDDPVIIVTNKAMPSIQIIKSDKNGPMEGVTFRIAPLGNATAYTDLTTDSAGIINFTGEPGFYTVVERSTLDTHIKDPTVHTIEIKSGQTEPYKLHITNKLKPTAILQKRDSITSDPLPGARFEAWYAGDSLGGSLEYLGEYVTDENGEIRLQLENAGWVRFIELESPEGYAMPENPVTDVFVPANTEKIIPVVNRPKSAIIVHKLDPDNNNAPISDTWIRLRYLSGTSGTGGTVIAEKKTTLNGTVVFTGLKAGTYIVEEFRSNPDYEISGKTTETVYVSGDETAVVEVILENRKKGGLIIQKLDESDHAKALAGAEFLITYANGEFVGDNNGRFTSGPDGLIKIDEVFAPGTTLIIREVKAPDGYVISEEARTIQIKANTTHTEVFYNRPQGNFTLTKTDADKPATRISGAQFEISKISGEIIGTYTTSSTGTISLQLASGTYRAVEISVKSPYKVDGTPHIFEVKDGKTTFLPVTNKAYSSALIRKVCADSGRGLYGATFLLYDSTKRPIMQVTSDQNGYIWLPDSIDPGETNRFYLRELTAPTGYKLSDELITIYTGPGRTEEILIKNTPIRAQIQILKISANDNPRNGIPAHSPLFGAVFIIRDKRTGNTVDTVTTGSDGRAVSRPLPLSRYECIEVQAPANYKLDGRIYDAELEYEGQIVKLTVTNESVSLGVSVKKRGYVEAVPGQQIRYDFSSIGNTSSVPLSSFYWRDTLPVDAVRLDKIVTGTWNQSLSYKVVYRTNISGDYKVLADNLSAAKIYVLDASPAALGLASNEYITEYMFVFGSVKAGFAQVEAPYIFCNALPGLPHEYRFVNKTDVGGQHNGEWVMAHSTWVTVIYSTGKPPKLPQTGY